MPTRHSTLKEISMVKIHTATTNLSEDELNQLARQGLEVKRNPDGGLDIVSHSRTMQPKTVTGFMDTVTGEFVAIVLDPVGQKSDDRKEKLVFWRR
jgi:hypothetical protein